MDMSITDDKKRKISYREVLAWVAIIFSTASIVYNLSGTLGDIRTAIAANVSKNEQQDIKFENLVKSIDKSLEALPKIDDRLRVIEEKITKITASQEADKAWMDRIEVVE